MKIAALTMVRDEDAFLTIWLNYYGSKLGIENLFVVDHGSIDSLCATLACSVWRLPRTELDETKRASLISNINSSLLEAYDAVIFCDVDEIIVPDPSIYRDIREFIEINNYPMIGGVGLALLHLRTVEDEWVPNVPILAQRQHVAFQTAHCKPTITKRPIRWNAGFHTAVGAVEIRSDLYMFHLKAMDYNLAHATLTKRQTTKFSKHSVEKRHSVQFHFDILKFDEIYFPFSEKDFEHVAEVFDFSVDVQEYAKSGVRHHVYGSLAIVPARFRGIF